MKRKDTVMSQFDPTTLKFNADGLIPAIAQDHRSGQVLMMAWMNAQAVQKTLTSGQVTYWSRSRQSYWIKGETSGHTQKLISARSDCDKDCLLLLVEQEGPACHTNRMSCFYTEISPEGEKELMAPVKDT